MCIEQTEQKMINLFITKKVLVAYAMIMVARPLAWPTYFSYHCSPLQKNVIVSCVFTRQV
jgi:hypothetical protein